MKQLKSYNNLYQFYRKSINKYKILMFVCLGLFVLGFVTLFFNNFPFGLTMTMMFMIFPAILFAVLWLISSIRTKKHLKALTPQDLSTINNEIPSKEQCEGLFVTSLAVVGTKMGLQFVPMANVLWVYNDVMTTKLYGVIPVHKATTLIFANRDHKQVSYSIKNNQKAFRFIQNELLKYRLDIVFGYERGMDDIYKKDINRLIAFSQECAEMRQKKTEE